MARFFLNVINRTFTKLIGHTFAVLSTSNSFLSGQNHLLILELLIRNSCQMRDWVPIQKSNFISSLSGFSTYFSGMSEWLPPFFFCSFLSYLKSMICFCFRWTLRPSVSSPFNIHIAPNHQITVEKLKWISNLNSFRMCDRCWFITLIYLRGTEVSENCWVENGFDLKWHKILLRYYDHRTISATILPQVTFIAGRATPIHAHTHIYASKNENEIF